MHATYYRKEKEEEIPSQSPHSVYFQRSVALEQSTILLEQHAKREIPQITSHSSFTATAGRFLNTVTTGKSPAASSRFVIMFIYMVNSGATVCM